MTIAGTLYDETVLRGTAKLLGSLTASNSSSLIFSTPLALGSGFDVFLFEIDTIQIPNASGSFGLQTSVDGGATWKTQYWHGAVSLFSNFSPSLYCYGSTAIGGTWANNFFLGHVSIDGHPFVGHVKLYNGPGSGALRHLMWQVSTINPSVYAYTHIGGGFTADPPHDRITAVKFYGHTGNITSGTIRLWGMRQ